MQRESSSLTPVRRASAALILRRARACAPVGTSPRLRSSATAARAHASSGRVTCCCNQWLRQFSPGARRGARRGCSTAFYALGAVVAAAQCTALQHVKGALGCLDGRAAAQAAPHGRHLGIDALASGSVLDDDSVERPVVWAGNLLQFPSRASEALKADALTTTFL